jgi:hypothetical protein
MRTFQRMQPFQPMGPFPLFAKLDAILFTRPVMDCVALDVA